MSSFFPENIVITYLSTENGVFKYQSIFHPNVDNWNGSDDVMWKNTITKDGVIVSEEIVDEKFISESLKYHAGYQDFKYFGKSKYNYDNYQLVEIQTSGKNSTCLSPR